MEKILKSINITIIIMLILSVSGCGRADRSASETEFMLDTACTITVSGSGSAAEIAAGALGTAKSIADTIDYFNPDSYTAQFNALPAHQPLELSEDAFNVISRALEIADASGGAFDITIAPVKNLWDFKSDDPRIPDPDELNDALRSVGYEKLILNRDERTLEKTEDGVEIDLGGCGKGNCCQAALDYIAENDPDCSAILDFGGNVAVYGKNPRTGGEFTVGIQDPKSETGVYSKTVSARSGQSVVTSGTYQRRFIKDGVNYHHLLDPKTGMPASNGNDSATIICDDGLLADCLSTACMVLPADDAQALAQSYGAELIFE